MSNEHSDEPRNGSGSQAKSRSSVGALIPWQPSSSEESTPLLHGKEARPRTSLVDYGPTILALSVVLFLVGNLIMHFAFCPVYPWTMSAVRLAWDNEIVQHDLLLQGWVQETKEHVSVRKAWELQTESHEKDVVRRIQVENERQERVRQIWDQERERHAREVEEFDKKAARRVREEEERYQRARKVWEQEVRNHEKEVAHRIDEEQRRQERVRMEWILEDERHQQECEEMERRESQHREDERRRWQQEVEDHHRLEEERRKREEEERQRLNMFWGGVTVLPCSSFATREYTAQLMNLPVTWEHPIEACKATSLEINGVSHLPKTCEEQGPGVVIGRWEINIYEPDCTTYWDSYNDKGCTSPGSGKKYVTHKLENLPENSDWRKFCATTPISFEHKQFQGAQECIQSIWGVYGQWELNDSSC